MIEYMVIIGLIIGAGFWIVFPLLKTAPLDSPYIPGRDEKLRQVTLKKEGVYETIKELEFDLKMGKLSDGDFQALRERYMMDAVDCLKEIDRLQSKKGKKMPIGKDHTTEIEKEVLVLRKTQGKGLEEEGKEK